MRSNAVLLSMFSLVSACALRSSDPANTQNRTDSPVVSAPQQRVQPPTQPRLPVPPPLTSACAVRLESSAHLRSVPLRESEGPELPAGTPVEILAATGILRNTALLTRVRVTSTGQEGYLFVRSEAVFGCPIAGRGVSTDPLVREERVVLIDGVQERWQLRWKQPPQAACRREDEYDCRCWDFTAGEEGHAELVRLRGGVVIDRFDRWQTRSEQGITEGDYLRLQRWSVADSSTTPLSDRYLRSQPEVSVLHFTDIDHDGRATEFVLRAAGMNDVCGHVPAYVVGISQREPRLHVFRRAEDPSRVAWLESARLWYQLSQQAPRLLTAWNCGDHGYDAIDAVRVSIEGGRFRYQWGHYEADERCRRTSAFIPGDSPNVVD